MNDRIRDIWVWKAVGRDVEGFRNSPGWNFYSGTCSEHDRRLSPTPLRVDIQPRKGSECVLCFWPLGRGTYPFFNSETVLRVSCSKINESVTLSWHKDPAPSGQGHVSLRSQWTTLGRGWWWAGGSEWWKGPFFSTEAGSWGPHGWQLESASRRIWLLEAFRGMLDYTSWYVVERIHIKGTVWTRSMAANP